MTTLARAKGVSLITSLFTSNPALLKEAAGNRQVRQLLEAAGAGLHSEQLDLSAAAKARPFVSSMAWALFSAYQAIAVQGLIKLQAIKSGISKEVTNKQAVAKLVKAALPHRTEYVDRYGDAAYHSLLDELEQRLLDEFQNMLAGREADKASVEKAAEILKVSKDVMDSTKEGAASAAALGADTD